MESNFWDSKQSISENLRQIPISQRLKRFLWKGFHGIQQYYAPVTDKHSNCALFEYYKQIVSQERMIQIQVNKLMDDYNCPTECLSNITSDQSMNTNQA